MRDQREAVRGNCFGAGAVEGSEHDGVRAVGGRSRPRAEPGYRQDGLLRDGMR